MHADDGREPLEEGNAEKHHHLLTWRAELENGRQQADGGLAAQSTRFMYNHLLHYQVHGGGLYKMVYYKYGAVPVCSWISQIPGMVGSWHVSIVVSPHHWVGVMPANKKLQFKGTV